MPCNWNPYFSWSGEGGFWTMDLTSWFAIAQAEENGDPQVSVLGDLLILDLSHQLWANR
jgi:hypothetical protein